MASTPRDRTGSLGEYRRRRDFQRTPEPTGGAPAGPGRGLAFCVQKHLASHLHYDVRLEWRGVLLSWAVPKGPSLDPRTRRLAMRVEDHPYDYGGFEGVIPEGYGAGIVLLWDRGTWTPDRPDVDDALARGELKFSLSGVKLKGSWVLVRTRRDERGWLLIKHADEWSSPEIDIAAVAPMSVTSGRDFAGILAAEDRDIWHSDRSAPAKGGTAGAMLREIIAEAARRRAGAPRPRRQRR